MVSSKKRKVADTSSTSSSTDNVESTSSPYTISTP
jgi:hypothetical protein